jgi:hypothetical protein
MRFLLSSIVMLMLACGAEAANAQGVCPFLAFCGAQQDHCHRNCGALTDVIAWGQREAFLQSCFSSCDHEGGRCTVSQTRRCFGR